MIESFPNISCGETVIDSSDSVLTTARGSFSFAVCFFAMLG